jgi:hypothetical protein
MPSCEDKIIVSSYSGDADDHDSLGTDQEQAPEAHASTYDAGSSSAMPQHRARVSSQRNLFTRKYEA